MELQQAESIVRKADARGMRARVHRISNNELVVIVNGIFIWTKDDWRKYATGTLPGLGKYHQFTSEEDDYTNALLDDEVEQ